MGIRVLSQRLAAGTTHTNSTDEAVLDSYTIPANFFNGTNGKSLHARGYALVADSNSTDTVVLRVRLGATTLTGTAIATTTAVDAADSDVCVYDIWLTVRDGDSSGTATTSVLMNDCDAVGTPADAFAVAVASLDFTAALLLEITADWSVAHADNQIAAQQFVVMEVVSDL